MLILGLRPLYLTADDIVDKRLPNLGCECKYGAVFIFAVTHTYCGCFDRAQIQVYF